MTGPDTVRMKSYYYLTLTNRSDFSEEKLAAIFAAFDREAVPAARRIKALLEKEFGAEYEFTHSNGVTKVVE